MKKFLVILCCLFTTLFSYAQPDNAQIIMEFSGGEVAEIALSRTAFLTMEVEVMGDKGAAWCNQELSNKVYFLDRTQKRFVRDTVPLDLPKDIAAEPFRFATQARFFLDAAKENSLDDLTFEDGWICQHIIDKVEESDKTGRTLVCTGQ